MAEMKAILVAVDGSECSDRAAKHGITLVRSGFCAELHLINVQPNLGGAIASFVGRGDIDAYQREEGKKALASAEALAKQAGVSATVHIGVGRQGAIISDFVRKLGAGLVVMGTRGHTGLAGVLLGSVAQDIIAHIDVPVTLVK